MSGPEPAAVGTRDVDPRIADEAFVLRHQAMVRKIARDLQRSLPPSVRFEDLEQAGMLGLLEARDRFDRDRGTRFSTFAWYRVRGAILDSLRRATWLPAGAWRTLRELEQRDDAVAIADSLAELDDPTRLDDAALAARFSQSVRHVATIGLMADCATGADDEAPVPASVADHDPGEQAARSEATARLHQVLERLPADQRQLVQMLYVDGLSTTAVAEHLGVHKSSISRAHHRLIDSLGAALQTLR